MDIERCENMLIIRFLRFLQPHLCGAKYPIKKVLKIHSFLQILEPILLLIGRDITLESGYSEFLYLREEYRIRLVLEIEPGL